MKNVFIIGSKGIPAQYGGFETFVENLTRYQKSEEIHYYVACMSDHNEVKTYNGADCFYIKVPGIGPAKAVYYDMAAFHWCNTYIREHGMKDAIVYVLACRIGPFIHHYKKKLAGMGGSLYVNPDGHEWKRAKWNAAIRRYWKLSEKLMVKHANLLVCDSKNIEQYIREQYKPYHPSTTFLAYGTQALDNHDMITDDWMQAKDRLASWYKEHGLAEESYYLVVGRFVPENNYETMIKEFMDSDTARKLVLITNVEQNKFYEELRQRTGFDKDDRICFAGTVYDEKLLTLIRCKAYGYLHGHEVGGTNPSLLEALSTTELNLLLDVGFNQEVGEDGAIYWTKESGNLAELIHEADSMEKSRREELGQTAHARMRQYYSWDGIVEQYEGLFLQ